MTIPREQYAEALHRLAEFYVTHPEAPLPNNADQLSFSCYDKAELQAVMRAFGGHWDKKPHPDVGLFYCFGYFGPLHLRAYTSQDRVCTRRIVGTREIPARAPMTVPVYEYDCGSVLEGEDA